MRRMHGVAKTVRNPVNTSQEENGVNGGGSAILQQRRIDEMKEWLLRLPPRAFAAQPPIKVYSVRHTDPFTVLQVLLSPFSSINPNSFCGLPQTLSSRQAITRSSHLDPRMTHYEPTANPRRGMNVREERSLVPTDYIDPDNLPTIPGGFGLSAIKSW